MLKYLKVKDIKNLKLLISADPEKFGWGRIKLIKLCIISKFWMFISNDIDLAQTYLAYF